MPRLEALAFDVYGTLVDPSRVWKQLERYIPKKHTLHISEVWRQKQLEYTFRLTAMGTYEDFEHVTRKALDYALVATGQELDPEQKDMLMAQYNDLELFEDVEPGLQRLREAGNQIIVFSNGAPHMLRVLMEQKGFNSYFQEFVSVDEVKAYKPSPKVYQHVADRLGRSIEEVRLISSNPFDIAGAENVGMRATWVDRSGGLFDMLSSRPEMVVGTLTELADALETRK